MKQQGFLPILVIILITVVTIAGYLAYQTVNKNSSTPPPNQVACTLEAKICPDGSSVGRVGPKCDFAPCPIPNESTSSADMTNWKTYKNEKYKFELKMPPDWEVSEEAVGNEGLHMGPISDKNHIGETVKPYVSSAIWLEIEKKDSPNSNLQNSSEKLLECFYGQGKQEHVKIEDKEVLVVREWPCGITTMEMLIWEDKDNLYLLKTYLKIDPFLTTFRLIQ